MTRTRILPWLSLPKGKGGIFCTTEKMKLNKIYLINRDRAMKILWIADAIYDELWYCNYSLVENEITKKEWMVIAPYFDPNNYRADTVIETLKNNHPLYNTLALL